MKIRFLALCLQLEKIRFRLTFLVEVMLYLTANMFGRRQKEGGRQLGWNREIIPIDRQFQDNC